MPASTDSLIPSTSRPLRMRRRQDLTVVRHRYQGRPFWVIKEPLGLRYYRFQEEEYAVLEMLDGDASIDDIKSQFDIRFQPQQIEHRELQQFVGTLHRMGLVTSDRLGQGTQLNRRGLKRKWKQRFSALANVLALRTRGVNPDGILDRLLPYTSWFFAKKMVLFVILLAITALTLLLVQWPVFRARLPGFHEFFGPQNWLLLGVVLAVTKVLHEFGHGLSCKRFGGECHEMGFMLLVLTPCLYCNVSDSWMLPSKWQRAAIGAAGIYVEMMIAATATFLWWFSEPGPLNHICLQLMFVCSVSTVLFNGNPLLRFDGYYILADIVEIPNLRQKASEILKRQFQKWCLGLKLQPNPFLPQRNQWLFALYTVAAVLYRWVILFSILMFLNKMFEPYGLEIIGKLIALSAVVGLFAMPLWQTYRFVSTPGRIDQVKLRNVAISVGVLSVIIGLIVFLPLPANVRCTLRIAPRDATSVCVTVNGLLGEARVHSGDIVEADEVIVRMVSPDLEIRIAQLNTEFRATTAQHDLLFRQSLTEEDKSRDLLQLQEMLRSLEAQLSELRRRQEGLIVRAPHGGIVFPPPVNQESSTRDTKELPVRSGTPLDDHNQGTPLQKGDVICDIGHPGQFEALLIVPESDIEFVIPGQTVRFQLDAYPGRTLQGQVVRPIVSEPVYLGADGSLHNDRPTGGAMSVAYPVRVAIDNPDPQWRPGLTGKAKIRIESLTLAARIRRFFIQSFRFS